MNGISALKKRIRRVTKRFGEKSSDSGLTVEQEIERVMRATLDRLNQEMKDRFNRLNDLNLKFGFMLDVKNLLSGNIDEVEKKCQNLGNFYDTDINGAELFHEINDCKILLAGRNETELSYPIELLKFIISYGDDVFPNLRISLQILLTIGVSISTCERSFSKLKLILSYLRSSMGQNRLRDLAILSIEREITAKINFDDVIDNFAAVKARKINLK